MTTKLNRGKMKKLELKDIAGYLPYKLRFAFWDTAKDGKRHNFRTKYPCAIQDNRSICFGHLSDGFTSYDLRSKANPFAERCLPVLRPMSDLTREITHKGKKFVPIMELAKIAYDGNGEWKRPRCYGDICQCDCNEVYFGYELDNGGFVVAFPDGGSVFAPKQRTLFDKLNEWMFDYRDLIGQGLAIDVNTLKENCYE